MTVSLLVFVPAALLVLVSAVCFVGCILPPAEYVDEVPPSAFTTYSDDDVIGNPACVAYWPLNDSPGQTVALDVVGKALGDPHDGTYHDAASDKNQFPCIAGSVNPTTNTADANGSLTIGASPGIVAGDTVPPNDPNSPTPQPCMLTDGAYVAVAANATCNPSAFSVECWVQPEWGDGAQQGTRQVLDARSNAPNVGYGLRVNEDGNWEADVGITNTATFIQIIGGKAALSEPTHLVLTCDSTKAELFVNGVSSAQTGFPSGETFAPNTVGRLVIGAGAPYLDDRAAGEVIAFPLFPFKGKIQDVAIYKKVLDAKTISDHTSHGNGKPVQAG